MMILQYVLVLIVCGLAVLYGVHLFRSAVRSFSAKGPCETNCGCSGYSNNLILKD